MNELQYFTFNNGAGIDVFLFGECIFCNESHSVRIPEEAFYKIERGTEHLQNILPSHTNSDREFLISGVCPHCQLGDGKTENERELNKLAYRFDVLKKDHEVFAAILAKNNIVTLYHFTDKSNLPSIEKHGALFSLQYLDEKRIEIARPGGSEISRKIDYRRGLANFIRLSFAKDHPMRFVAQKEGRITTPVLIEVDANLILTKPSLFSRINAADKNADIYDDSANFSKIDFSLFKKDYRLLNGDEKKDYQAEVLIPERIDWRFIKKIG